MPSKDDILTDDEANQIITGLYERGHGLALYTVDQILGLQLSRSEKEDLIQECFVRMVIHVEALREKSWAERVSYLRSTMRNVAIDEGRRRSKEKLLSVPCTDECFEIPSQDLTPEEYCILKAEIAEKQRLLSAVLDRLEPRDRALLIEKYKNGLSDSEIGHKLGIKVRNVRVYLARARRKAAMYYGEELDEERRKKQSRKESDHQKGQKGLRGVTT